GAELYRDAMGVVIALGTQPGRRRFCVFKIALGQGGALVRHMRLGSDHHHAVAGSCLGQAGTSLGGGVATTNNYDSTHDCSFFLLRAVFDAGSPCDLRNACVAFSTSGKLACRRHNISNKTGTSSGSRQDRNARSRVMATALISSCLRRPASVRVAYRTRPSLGSCENLISPIS